MILFDNMLGDLPSQYIAIGLSAVATLTTLAAVAWWKDRRAAACRPFVVENRAWTYCPKCGWFRPADESVASPDTATRPIRDAITVAGTLTANTRLQPSELLRQGWTRAAAVDVDGRIVLPCDPSAVAWSIWGALNRAYKPGGDEWKASVRHLADIITKSEGGRTMSVQKWNRAANRTHSEILSVAAEIQRRTGR